jgi:hypothetical protein
MVEVLSKTPSGHFGAQVHVRGADDGDIHGLARRASESTYHLFLEHLQELGLHPLG